MTYVIHGATGAQGGPVVAALTAVGKPVVALTRRQDAVVNGARVRAVDASSVEQLAEAYRGADGVFVHLPMASEADREAFASSVVAALGEVRPARVVFSTSGSVVVPEGDAGQSTSAGVSTLINGLEETGLDHVVVAPRLFLENLLMPPVVASARERGSLPYPLRADFPVSWASHLDVADVVAELFVRREVPGVVEVGHDPAILGADLAGAFGTRLGHDVAYQALTPAAFGEIIKPLLGPASTGVVGLYEYLGSLAHAAIAPGRSAQSLLGIMPRSVQQWLADVSL